MRTSAVKKRKYRKEMVGKKKTVEVREKYSAGIEKKLLRGERENNLKTRNKLFSLPVLGIFIV